LTDIKKIAIAIDGYSSTGKSTLAKNLAQKLKYSYVNTGAMYRSVALHYLRQQKKIAKDVKIKEVIKSLNNIHIAFFFNEDNNTDEVFLNGENVHNKINSLEVSNLVSKISKIKEVRNFMVRIQKELGKNKAVVMEGRDIGTVVLPQAEVKIFMTAKKKIRAKRRLDELQKKGYKVSLEEVLENIEDRDFQDENRIESPLKKPDKAYVIDNSNMSLNEQLDVALKIVLKVLNM